jgi:nucleotide sugar dehydrogenase
MGMDIDFKNFIKNKSITLGVVGLGYVGLPTAIAFYDAGFSVIGIDNSDEVVNYLKNNINPLDEPNLDNSIPDSDSNRWNITKSFENSVNKCDIILVTVPTPVNENRKIDTTYVKEAGNSIFENIKKGNNTIVVLESTVYPGLTKKVWLPIIQRLDLVIGTDVSLAYCPERYNPGDSKHSIAEVARVVGSMDKKIGENLVVLYSEITSSSVTYVGSMEVAESSKLIENVQRDINIALVNELSMILPKLGVDIEEVLDAASTKWNFHRYSPGIGVGGHCIPVDPYFLIDQAYENNSPVNLISSAREINDKMPSFIGNEINNLLDDMSIDKNNRKALLLGWSYKQGIGDVRGSPSKYLASSLVSYGFEISVWDPYISIEELPNKVNKINHYSDSSEYDVVILATSHSEFLSIDWKDLKKFMNNPILYDGRRVLDLDLISELGWVTAAIGKPFHHKGFNF